MHAPRWIHRRVGSAIALTALTIGITGIPASAAGTVVVDRDGAASIGDCGDAAATGDSIQDAIDAAGAGTTILVCPGTYRERLTIGPGKDGLTVRAVVPFGARVRVPQGIDAEALLLVDGADSVEVRGLSFVSGGGPTCGVVDAAILVRDAQDAVIRGNRIRPSTIDTINPCGFPYGIAIGGPGVTVSIPAPTPPASALVGWNLVRDPLFGGIIVAGHDTSATLTRNSVRYWHLEETTGAAARLKPAGLNGVFVTVGIGVEGGADAVVTGNAVTGGPDAQPAGGRLGPVRIRRASPAGTDTPLLYEGIAALRAGTVRVAGNLVQRVFLGIAVTSSNTARVVDNDIRTVTGGILGASDGARYLDNTISGATLGIVTSAIDGVFRRNAVTSSSLADCTDDTTGGGTLGTANTWDANTGTTSSPIGICGSGAPGITVKFTVTIQSTNTAAVGSGPYQIASTRLPGAPIVLTESGPDVWTTKVVLPLGEAYKYHYEDSAGNDEISCSPGRLLIVVDQGSLSMTITDTVEGFSGVAGC